MLHRTDPGPALLERLNDVQREGVLHGEGPLLILAGAGSGKTRVLTRRLAYLIAAREVAPDRILAVTFTNKAAQEMRERVASLLTESVRPSWLGTFHSICLRLLKRHQDRLGFKGALTVFDTEDQIALVREVLKELAIPDAPRARDALAAISQAKNHLQTPAAFLQLGGGPARERIARVWVRYEERLRELDGVDFDDLLLLALRLLEEEHDLGERYAERFLHILVDEYQDTNRAQFHIVRRLAQRHRNVVVVGDDDQSIYAWRGADITNILEFERHFPGARVLRLEQNYRSTGAILAVANAVVSHNKGRKPKRLWTENGVGSKVRLHIAEDEEREARYVARRIAEAIRSGAEPGEVAVLYRTHAQSRPLEEALLRGEVAYRVVGGVSFYQRREVKDLLAYLRLLVNPRDEVSFRRAALAPRRGAGEKTIDRLIAGAREREWDLVAASAQAESLEIGGRGVRGLIGLGELLQGLALRVHEPPHALLEAVVSAVDYRGYLKEQSEGDWEERWAHVLELIEGARSYEQSEDEAALAGYLEQVALYAQTDDLARGEERVTLMSAHNAKGLEFTHVLITGLEEGLFPHASALSDPQEMEEERRLFYVGITRARKELTLTASRQRRRINFMGGSDLSRFLSEIPQEMLEPDGVSLSPMRAYRPAVVARARGGYRDDPGGGDEPAIERGPAPRSLARLQARHVRYGIGEVLSIDGSGEDARVEVRFPVWGVKRILRAYLTLEEKR